MLIPLGHDRMATRRWPVVTLALIALNILAFLATFTVIEQEAAELGETKLHLLMLAAMHPELTITGEAQEFVAQFRENNPGLWSQIANPNRNLEDAWDVEMRMIEEPTVLQAEMDRLTMKFTELRQASVIEKYAFVPSERDVKTYLTANFLHGGWLHLIGNMWFLWLAGFILEDVWGRPIYSVFYLLAGAMAMQFYAWTNAGSVIPTVGASGAVAGCMGAFLVRFPTTQIDMAWFFRFRLYRFKMAAIWLLPAWVLMEVFYGTLFGSMTGVAHWAHVGGFIFGAVVALSLKFSGWEAKLDQQLEEQVTLAADPEIAEASTLIERREYEPALQMLQAYTAKKPNSFDAFNLLQQAYWRMGDVARYQEAMQKVIALHLKAREYEPALQGFDEYLQTGGNAAKFAVATWLELARAAETLGQPDRARAEFEKIAVAHAGSRAELDAHLGAARVLKKLGRSAEALQKYQAVKASPIPHLDLEMAVETGIKELSAAKSAAGPA